MKRRKKNKFSAKISKFSGKIGYAFARISTLTGYIIALLAAFSFSVNKDPKGAVELVPLAKLFFEAAKITVELESKREESNKPQNPE